MFNSSGFFTPVYAPLDERYESAECYELPDHKYSKDKMLKEEQKEFAPIVESTKSVYDYDYDKVWDTDKIYGG